MTKTTILCTDGSELALHALRAGLSLVLPPERTVVATVVDGVDEMDVVGTGFGGGVMSPEAADKRRTEQQAEGERIIEQTLIALGIDDAETRVLDGHPGSALCALATEVGASLLVLGSRGRGGIRRALLGSVSDHVVRNATCTVMVTRADST